MKFIEFKQKLANFRVFSSSDIRKLDKNFDPRRLTEWLYKGYIQRVKRGYYVFSESQLDEPSLFVIANKIYQPSYISLESALSYYHLIPESVYSVTSVSTKKTMIFDTASGLFAYRTVKRELYFGYQLVSFNGRTFRIADKEKLLLDYLYLRPELKDENDFMELRLNQEELKSQFNRQRLVKYLRKFDQKSLAKRTQLLLAIYDL